MKFKNQVVFITGASSGIGEALAKAFAKEGADLVLIARRHERLKTLRDELEKKGRRVLPIACDVTKDGDLERAVYKAREEFGRIDVVVANAGFSVVGKFERLKLSDFRRQFETNVFGALRTVQATLEDLKRSKGKLVFIGSISGHVSLPELTPYSMSKFALRALSESLHAELKREGVSVTHISPGFIESEIRFVNNRGLLDITRKDSIPKWLQMPASKAAREIVKAIQRRDREEIITLHGKILVWFKRFLPGLLAWLFQIYAKKLRETKTHKKHTENFRSRKVS